MPQDHPSFTQSATYADLCAVPDHMTAEIIGGVLITQPQPALRHMKPATNLQQGLSGPDEQGANGPGGWVFIAEPEVHVDDHIVVPDTAGWRMYGEAGVSFLRQADHPSRTIETFQRHDAGLLCGPTIADTGRVAVEPFAATPFEAELSWRALGPADTTASEAPART
ncbi:MAG: hypothetical protein AAFR55_05670 [Pseudomonadota bacterium]